MSIDSNVSCGADSGKGVEQQFSKVVVISEPGYYRIGDGVHTLKCLNQQVVIVSASATFSLHIGGIYAPSCGKSEDAQWIWVGQKMLADGPLRLEVSCMEDGQPDQLLVRDAEKEKSVADMLAGTRQGVATQADTALAQVYLRD